MKNIKKNVFLLMAFIVLNNSSFGQQIINLAGKWQFQIDPENVGIAQRWYDKILKDTLSLPGSLQAQGYGNDITAETKWYSGKLTGIWQTSPIYAKYRQPGNVKIFEWLQPKKHYIGAAWYQLKIKIPVSRMKKRNLLFLERVHWSSMVWLDNHLVGTKRSLGTPHEYDLTSFLSPGDHLLTIRIDNSQIVDVGKIPHSVSDETQTAWNGIIGKIQLITTPLIWVDNIQVYPNIKSKYAKVLFTIKKKIDNSISANLCLQATSFNTVRSQKIKPLSQAISLNKEETTIAIYYPLGDRMQLWSSFHPTLYHLNIQLKASHNQSFILDTVSTNFGMRDFTTKETRFQLNGKPISIRGNVNNCEFPLTGYPRMDVNWWKKQWQIYKDWGLNAAHFHSWCPPEAAFEAADEVGIFLQPEVGEWSRYKTLQQDSFFREESALILRKYGNHPSFVMMALGNELNADSTLLYNLVGYWQKMDNRRVYSGKTAGNPVTDNFQFYNTGKYKGLALRYHSGPVGGWPPHPGGSLFNILPPETNLDYREAVNAYNKPLVTHELGQLCSFPDVLHEPAKYKGLLQASYLDIARDQLEERGMLSQVPNFVQASGKWQIQLYKEEIEANMRTPGIAGFDLLSLEDFSGQSSAPVGFLNVFYENKGYITPKSFRRFCSPQVVLARMPKRILESNEYLKADILLYNFAEEPVNISAINCKIKDNTGKTIWRKTFMGKKFPIGNDLSIGNISIGLESYKASAKYNLSVSVPGTSIINDWDFWVFPASTPKADTSSILVTNVFNPHIEEQLKSGAKVLLLPDSTTIKGGLPICFTDFYWTAFNLNGGTSSADGLLCNPAHDVFKYFPTSFHSDWQWFDLLTRARPMILDSFKESNPWPKGYQPLIQMIDSWKVNRKLAVLVEAKVGKGKIIICSIDLEHDMAQRPASRQFRYSLLKYMGSENFDPSNEVTSQMISNLFINKTAGNQ